MGALAFFSLFGMIIGSSHYYIFARLSDYFALEPGGRQAAGLLMAFLSLLTLLTIPLSHALPRRAAVFFSWIAYTWMGFVLLLFSVVVVTDISWLLLHLLPLAAFNDPARLQSLRLCFGVLALAGTVTLSAFSIWNGLRPASVKELTVRLKKLPAALDGFRLVQLSDLHIDKLSRHGWLEKIVAKTNDLKPDLIAVTGDLVDGSVADLGALVAPLGVLKAPQGVYFITGNHEYYSGVKDWCAFVASLGLRLLRNERVRITRASPLEDNQLTADSFDLAGVDDWAAGRFGGQGPDLKKALAGRDTAKALVLLAHQPSAIEEAAALGVDLQLSGHTHGGQIWPFNLLVRLQQPYVQGLFRHRGTETQIYVSPGTGFWGPPMRFGTTAEITHITLRSDP